MVVTSEYHLTLLPVADKSATVGESIEQKLWEASPVGAAGSDRVTVTSKVVELSQPVNTLSWVALYTEPSTKASPDANNPPKLSYHFMLFPDAAKSATVGESIEQKFWG